MARSDQAVTADQGPVPDTALDQFVGYNLKRVYMIFNSDFRQTLGDGGLSTRVFSVLSLIVGNPGITQSEVARRLGIERSGLVAIVDDLQKRAYAERAPVRGDRRVQALFPTPAGEAAHAAATTAVAVHEEQLLSVLTGEERAQLTEVLAKLRWAHEGES